MAMESGSIFASVVAESTERSPLFLSTSMARNEPNTGTVSTLRLRGHTRPCYNIVEVSGNHVDVWRRYPFHGQERIIQFDLATGEYEKYTGRIEREVSAKR